MAETKAIPEAVLDALEEVRDDGKYNMMSRGPIIREMMQREEADDTFLDMGEYRAAISWLVGNEARYMEAVIANGERRKAPAS